MNFLKHNASLFHKLISLFVIFKGLLSVLIFASIFPLGEVYTFAATTQISQHQNESNTVHLSKVAQLRRRKAKRKLQAENKLIISKTNEVKISEKSKIINLDLFERNSNVNSVDLENTNITDAQLIYLTKTYPNIKHLNIKNCHKLSSISFEYIAHQLKQLQTLDLDHTRITETELLSIISNNDHSLKKISVKNCESISKNTLTEITKKYHNIQIYSALN